MTDMATKYGLILVAVAALTMAAFTRDQTKREPVIGSCDGCDAAFEGLPSQLESTGRIAPAGEPGQPMRITGLVRDRQGRPAAGIIVYAYQTDAGGLYPTANTRHGRLRGWVRSDASGRYRFDTIRPGGYPNTNIPQHVHMHVIEPGRATYYIDEIVFSDDPRLTPPARKQSGTGRGGEAVVTPTRDRDGTWLVTRDIVLGLNVPGYPVK
jgi:protocatechuate 3,4-dioxygenase beta subunit